MMDFKAKETMFKDTLVDIYVNTNTGGLPFKVGVELWFKGAEANLIFVLGALYGKGFSNKVEDITGWIHEYFTAMKDNSFWEEADYMAYEKSGGSIN